MKNVLGSGINNWRRLAWAVVPVGFALLGSIPVANAQIADGLHGYWPFDQTEGDIADNLGSSGVPANLFGPDWVVDEGRTALEFFRDESDYVQTNVFVNPLAIDEDLAEPGQLVDYSWSFWARNGEGNGNNDTVFGNRFNGDGDYRTFIKFTPTNFEYDRQDPGPENVSLNGGAQISSEWTHHAIVKTGPTLTYYLNGEEENILDLEDELAVQNPQPIFFGGDETRENWTGLIDDAAVWERAIGLDEVAAIFEAGTEGIGSLIGDVEVPLPPVAGRDTVGTTVISGSRANQVFGEAGPNVPGLGQSWYQVGNPGNKAGIDAAVENNDRIVPFFHGSNGTWWSGSQTLPDIQNYPVETEVAGVFEGDNRDQYIAILTGDILIEESGPIRFLDGVDDYTYLAIDTDRSGVAGDSEEEILINDNSWTNAVSIANGGAEIVEVDFEDIAEGGEWLAIEFNMGEGGGGDHGILYWDFNDEFELFPIERGEGIVFEEDAVELQIPDTHLRGPDSPAPLLSGDAVGTAPVSPRGWEIDVDPAAGVADVFQLENPDEDIFTTILDVDGLELHINNIGDTPEEGASFLVIDADQIVGTPTIATEGWSFDPATGSIVFGDVASCNPNTLGDIDGSGDVAFADFLILSQNFGQAATDHTTGDIDCSGDVAFADFLVLSQNFGQTVGGAETVPEPSTLGLFGISALFLGCLRRRRN